MCSCHFTTELLKRRYINNQTFSFTFTFNTLTHTPTQWTGDSFVDDCVNQCLIYKSARMSHACIVDRRPP